MQQLRSAALIAALFVAPCAFATGSNSDALGIKLQERFPDIKIQAVQASPWPGVYEVITPDEIVYSDENGERLIIGNMIDTKTHANLTEQRWNEVNKIDFNSLPFEQAIKIVKGDGSRKLAIFEDPFCPYCQELEQTLSAMTDMTIYVFLYPLEEVHPGASIAARDIWCAADRAQAWSTWMQTRKAPAENDCKSTPLESLAALGKHLKINSTPTLFFANGYRVPGAVGVDKLQRLLTLASQ